jgi:hypothetical protein
MSIRFLIATALMASACAAHADVIPATGGINNGSNVANAIGDSSVIAGVNRAAGSDALVQALYEKVSASVGSDMKVSLKQGIDGVYVTGLSTAKAVALAGDGMQVISTADGFKIVAAGGGADQKSGGNNGGGNNGGGNGGSNNGAGNGADNAANNGNGANNANGANNGKGPGIGDGAGLNDKINPLPDEALENGQGAGNGNSQGNGQGNGLGNQVADAVDLPEPSSVALMLAGLLGVAGLGRRRAR